MIIQIASPLIAQKILKLAGRYGLSHADVVSLAVAELWDNQGSTPEKDLYQTELVKAYLEKQQELEEIKRKIDETL